MPVNFELHEAVKSGNLPLATSLIEKDRADVNAVDSTGARPLHVAIQYGVTEEKKILLLSLLLRNDASLSLVNREGETPLFLASKKGYLVVVRHLLAHIAFYPLLKYDINQADFQGRTPLYVASEMNHPEIVKLLLEHNAGVNARDNTGMMPLHIASSKGNVGVARLLLEHNADVNAEDNIGMTALLYRDFGPNKEAMSVLLLEYGANYGKEEKQALTAMDEAFKKIPALEDCFPYPSGYQSPGRRKRNALREGCEISWGDVDELNEEKEKTRELSKIEINSDKFLDKLKVPGISEVKRTQLLQLADKVRITGNSKEELEKLVKQNNRLIYLQKVGYVSGIAMHGMIAKNLLGDFLQGNWEGVAINLGFIAGSQGFARVAEAASVKGMELLSKGELSTGKLFLGQSLRLASPFLARVTSVFIGYDLVNQYKAYRAGNPDAVVGMVGDGIYLGIDGLEVGIEIAEISGLLEGVSSVTGPIGAAVGAMVFVGTDVYLAVKRVDRIDALIHLTTKEKFVEGLRAFISMKPEQYIEELLEEKQGNNQLYQQGIAFLKNHTDFQRYIFPTVEAYPIDKLQIGLNNTVFLWHKVINRFKWGRMKPDITEGNLFCAPAGNDPEHDLETPPEGAYYCANAMGIEYSASRTGNITLIALGEGTDQIHGFPEGDHLVLLGNGLKNVTLGNGNNTFMLTGTPNPSSFLHARDAGMNTLDLVGFARDDESLMIDVFRLGEVENPNVSIIVLSKKEKNREVPYLIEILGMNRLLLRPHKQDLVKICSDAIHYVDGRGGESDLLWDMINVVRCSKEVESNQVYHYALTLIVRPNTLLNNAMENGEFTYIISNGELGRAQINIRGHQDILHRFLFNYTLDNLSNLKIGGAEFSLGFINSSLRQSANTELANQFELVIRSFSNNTLYQLSDGTEIKVRDRSFYGFQHTNSSIEEIIKDYPPIAERLNLSLFMQSSLSNESVAIGHGKRDVLSNDPYRRSHLVGNAGENIFVIRSGDAVLDKSKLPLPEVVLYDKDEENLIDTLDLREIRSQLEECYGVEIKARASLIVDTSDIAIELFFAENASRSLVMVRLKDALVTNWHERLHIMLNHMPMVLDELDLKPLPLTFGPDKEIIIISSEDVEEDTQLIIPKLLGHYCFMRWRDSLFVSNIWDGNLTDSQRYTILLKGFYQSPTLATLLIKFADKELALTDERANIENATDFLIEYERHNQTLYEMLFNNKETTSRPRAYRSHIRVPEELLTNVEGIDKKVSYESIWQSGTGYFLMAGGVVIFGMSSIAAVMAAGMVGYRYLRGWRAVPLNSVPAVINKQAIVLGVSLLAEKTVEAKSVDEKKINDEGGQAIKGDPSSIAFTKDSIGAFYLLKYVLHYLGWKAAVNRMNQMELLQENRSSGATSVLDAVEKKVKVALAKCESRYGIHDKTVKKTLFYGDKSVSNLQSVDESLALKSRAATHFFKVPIQGMVVNDSSMNISSTKQAYAIGQ